MKRIWLKSALMVLALAACGAKTENSVEVNVCTSFRLSAILFGLTIACGFVFHSFRA